jgi:UDP-3-O-[3-hydroxymyristoyl] glucosamine N-acyltransferase
MWRSLRGYQPRITGELSRDVVVGPFVVFELNVTVGEGAVIQAHVMLKEGAVIRPGVTVEAGAVIREAPDLRPPD